MPTAESPPTTLTLADAKGDLLDTDSEKPTTGPNYVDVLQMDVEVQGGDLMLRYDLVGDPPESLDALYTTVGYYLLVDVDGDESPDYFIDLSSTDDWSPNLYDVAEGYNYGGTEFPGSGVTDGTLVLLRVDLSALGDPSQFAIQGRVQYEDFPDPVGDPLTSTTAEDRIPDADSAWLLLGAR